MCRSNLYFVEHSYSQVVQLYVFFPVFAKEPFLDTVLLQSRSSPELFPGLSSSLHDNAPETKKNRKIQWYES